MDTLFGAPDRSLASAHVAEEPQHGLLLPEEEPGADAGPYTAGHRVQDPPTAVVIEIDGDLHRASLAPAACAGLWM